MMRFNIQKINYNMAMYRVEADHWYYGSTYEEYIVDMSEIWDKYPGEIEDEEEKEEMQKDYKELYRQLIKALDPYNTYEEYTITAIIKLDGQLLEHEEFKGGLGELTEK